MKTIIPKTAIAFLLFVIPFFGCKKSDFLNANPNQSVIVPSTLNDLQELLDNDLVLNGSGNYGIVPALGETGSDNYYCSEDGYNSVLTPLYRNAYVWAKNVYTGEVIFDWVFPYRAIFYSNLVLEGLAKIKTTGENETTWNNERGQALFNRAHMFYQLAQVFAPPYNKNDDSTQLGIPLRLKADVNEKIKRSTLHQTYDQIISDLKEAIPLLPVNPLYKTRPSKPAGYALLARIYQTMSDYSNALLYADSCLRLYNALIDYNSLDQTIFTPFTRFNDEVIFNCVLQSTDNVPFLPIIVGFVDSTLYNSYKANDLRKSIFFKDLGGGGLTFLGSYDGQYVPFAGIATDEVYLIRAECYARKGNTAASMNDLNTLLEKRWKTGKFVPLTANSSDEALSQVLIERRKELVFRGLRWTDLRRLNKDPRFAITLTRVLNGHTYTLPPNDPRYVYPIPSNVIGFNPGMEQNIR